MQNHILRVSAAGHAYDVVVRDRLLENVGSEAAKIDSLRPGAICALISDEHVASLYGARVTRSLQAVGYRPFSVVVPPGETTKTMAQAASVADALVAGGLDRHGFVVALGGGVVGDLAGFVASIYYRGIPCLQAPTTVVAQVDSAIGGKTAVNTVSGKNLLGTFHPPALVLVDPETLQSLPDREFNSGFAEVIKHAVIRDQALFGRLATFQRADTELMPSIIFRNLEIKAHIVASDEFERLGIRALLNFGHTIGHGIEQAGDYRRFLHGEAVALGMVAAARLSVLKVGLPASDCQRIISLLEAFNLPVVLPQDVSTTAVMASLARDKKFVAGEVRFVLVPEIGQARLSTPGEVTTEDLCRAVDGLCVP